MKVLTVFGIMLCTLLFKTGHVSGQTTGTEPEGGEYIKALRKKLLKDSGYDRYTRPVKHHTNATKVHLDIYFRKLFYVNYERHTIGLSLSMIQEWTDDHLTWDPKDFGGLSKVRVMKEEIWNPDIVQLNEAYAGFWSITPMAILYSTGKVDMASLVTSYPYCPMDFRDFPFDEQSCRIMYISWTLSAKELITSGVVSFDDTKSHPDWEIKASSKQTVLDYPEYNISWPLLDIELMLIRKSYHYRYYLLLPYSGVCLFTFLMFLLPQTCETKITLGCANVVMLLVFLNKLSTLLKGSIRVPKIYISLGTILILQGFSIAIAVVVLNATRSSLPFKAPSFIVNLLKLSFFGKILFLCPLTDPNTAPLAAPEGQFHENKESFYKKQDWYLVMQATERISLVLFAIIFVCCHL